MKKERIRIDELESEGYQIIRKSESLYVVGGDKKGLMYGVLDLRDQIETTGSLDREQGITGSICTVP
ncbi:hypothetical protein ACFLTA_04625 [Bacteroidota bacterium]